MAKKRATKTGESKAVKKTTKKATAVKKNTTKKTANKDTTKKPAVKTAAKTATRKPVSKIKRDSKKGAEDFSPEPMTPQAALKKIKGYGKKDLNEFKEIIIEKREEIVEQLQNLKDQMMDPSTGQYVNENSPYSLHMAEQGTDAQEREKLYLWAQRETKFLGYLDDALQRIELGTYGICIDSLANPKKVKPHLIPKNRLKAVPHTQHCVECKNKAKINR